MQTRLHPGSELKGQGGTHAERTSGTPQHVADVQTVDTGLCVTRY